MIDRVFAAPKGAPLEDGIRFAVENRVDFELPGFYTVENLDNSASEIPRVQGLLRDFSGILSIHGPIYDINVVSLDPEIRRVSRHRYRQAIQVARAMDARYLILHSQWTPIYPAANASQLWLDSIVAYWRELFPELLEGSNLTVLLENFLDPTPDMLLKTLSQVDSPYLRACLDTGHVNIFSSLPLTDWVRALSGYLSYIHAHNNGGQVDSHDAFDEGVLDMDAFLNHITLLPQKIHLAIETHTIQALASSYTLVKPYLHRQREQLVSKSFLI